MRSRFASIIVGLYACIVLHADAGQISLETLPSSSFSSNQVSISLSIQNKGNESAYNIHVEATCLDRHVSSSLHPLLGVNEKTVLTMNLGPAPSPNGAHTVILRTTYHDGNGHPFTAIRAADLLTADMDPVDKPVSADIPFVELRGRTKTTLTLSSKLSKPVDVKLTPAIPDELAIKGLPSHVTLEPGTSMAVPFSIKPSNTTPDSLYFSFIVLDYETDGLHRSTTAPFNIKVLPDTTPQLVLGLFAALLLLVFIIAQFVTRRDAQGLTATARLVRPEFILDLTVLALLYGYLIYHLPPSLILLNTTVTGGDTPAHNYIASHLREQLLGHGRIISWSDGWWCGFPLFQYYFSLPYVMMALLSAVIPLPVAIKLISVCGVYALPAAAMLATRIMKLPRPAHLLAAIAMIFLLFDRTHTIWGVNIYSTLSGMIANSISFAIMVVALPSAIRDASEGKFRISTTLLLAATIASHFFTTVILFLSIAITPFLLKRRDFLKACITLASEGGLAALLMAWWLIPLLAKSEFSMDFGTNWEVPFLAGLSRTAQIMLIVFPAALAFLLRSLSCQVRVLLWMASGSLFLFFFGYHYVSEVFVNIRLWPFLIYSLLLLLASGLGILLARARLPGFAVLALAILVLCFGIGRPNHTRFWAHWNYEGLEQKPAFMEFSSLVDPLKGTPGRLANDLHPDNNMMGSSRIFECVPYRIGKPVLEGGLVNSAAGSMYSYYIQGETSTNSAGFPTIVRPASFNFEHATKHLELFNVKHFIARWEGTKLALASSPAWKHLATSGSWQSYELTTHNANYVFIPERQPLAVATGKGDSDWKHAGLEWIYTFKMGEQPFILLRAEESPAAAGTPINHDAFMTILAAAKADVFPLEGSKIPVSQYQITDERISSDSIRFNTSATGLPHIVKCSYFPNWKSRNGEHVYMVTPCFMLIYPVTTQVELYYGYTFPDIAGMTISWIAVLFVIGYIVLRWRTSSAAKHA